MNNPFAFNLKSNVHKWFNITFNIKPFINQSYY